MSPKRAFRNRTLLRVMVVLGVLSGLFIVAGVAVDPSSGVYLALLAPALVLVVSGLLLLRRSRRP